MTKRALQIGTLAFGLLMVVHWLEVLSYTSFKGTKVFGDRAQQIELAVCSVTLVGLGLYFVVDAVGRFR